MAGTARIDSKIELAVSFLQITALSEKDVMTEALLRFSDEISPDVSSP